MYLFVRLALLLILVLIAWACGPKAEIGSPLNRVDDWFILLDYSPDENPLSPSDLSCYQMGILDPDVHPSLETLPKKMVKIAYVSVGEAEDYRSYWPAIKGSKWILEENKDWGGNYTVDPRSPEWTKVLTEIVIPDLVKKGFQGIMMDTLDTVDVLSDQDPDHAKEYEQAMIDLVAAIHHAFPDLFLISNNGFTILDQIAPYLSGMVVEDIYWMADFDNGGYRTVPAAWTEAKIATLLPLMDAYYLPTFDIEYLDPDNKKEIKKTKKRVKRLGFKPYFAEKDLDRFYPTGNRKCH